MAKNKNDIQDILIYVGLAVAVYFGFKYFTKPKTDTTTSNNNSTSSNTSTTTTTQTTTIPVSNISVIQPAITLAPRIDEGR